MQYYCHDTEILLGQTHTKHQDGHRDTVRTETDLLWDRTELLLGQTHKI